MAITEEQQLVYIKEKFCARIHEVMTLSEMVDFITNITPAAIRTYLQNKLQETADETRIKSTEMASLADDLEILKDSL